MIRDAAGRVQDLMRPGLIQLSSLPPLALYVHLPWCLRKCPYCDFNSHERQQGVDEETASRYLAALRADLEAALPLVWGRPIVSVFIGGGTPSLFSPRQVEQLLSDLRALLPFESGAEITLEANPGTFERGRFRDYRTAGVTRLSIGVQSFSDAHLKALGRVHDGDQARRAVAEAAECFETFNLDLMYALPGQTVQELQADLGTALAFAPPHLSVYHLTIEPNTRFALNPPTVPDDDTASDMLDCIRDRAVSSGMERYEVSAYARPGHRCAHNLNYWRFGDYLGIGAGAHSKLSFPHRILRQVRWREPRTYMEQATQGTAVSNEHEVGRADLPFEFALNALRLAQGVPLSLFMERTGLPLSAIRNAMNQGVSRGLLVAEAAQICATAQGFDFLSDTQALFLPP